MTKIWKHRFYSGQYGSKGIAGHNSLLPRFRTLTILPYSYCLLFCSRQGFRIPASRLLPAYHSHFNLLPIMVLKRPSYSLFWLATPNGICAAGTSNRFSRCTIWSSKKMCGFRIFRTRAFSIPPRKNNWSTSMPNAQESSVLVHEQEHYELLQWRSV